MPQTWTEQDLLDLITNQIQESIVLDYKESAALEKTDGKKNELSKDVSAFANSAGGTIIYGVAEQAYLPTQIDGGYDPTYITREWIEQVINSTIQPRIEGIKIHSIALPQSSPNRV